MGNLLDRTAASGLENLVSSFTLREKHCAEPGLGGGGHPAPRVPGITGLVSGYLSQSSKLYGVLEASEHSLYAFLS